MLCEHAPILRPLPAPSRPDVFFVRYSNNIQLDPYLEYPANNYLKAIGAAQDAARMERVVNFYAGLPRGPAPEVKATGLLGRYQARFFNKNSGAREFGPELITRNKQLANSNSPCPRHRRYSDPRLQHGVLLPPAYVTTSNLSIALR